jgi:DNA gyrase subunit A
MCICISRLIAPINQLLFLGDSFLVVFFVLSMCEFVLFKSIFMLFIQMGYASRFTLSDSEIRVRGRSSMGVIGMRLRDHDEIVDIDVLHHGTIAKTTGIKGKSNKKRDKEEEEKKKNTGGPENNLKSDILVLTAHGFGKRTRIDQFATKHRGGLGFSVIKFKKEKSAKSSGIELGLGSETTTAQSKSVKSQLSSKKKDTIACVRACGVNDEILLSTSSGVIVRQRIANIPRQSRTATGVLIQKLDSGATISDVAIVPHSPSNEIEGENPVIV